MRFPWNPLALLRRLKHHLCHTVDTAWLRSRGLILGERVYFGPDTIIDSYHAWLISIGNDCTFAPRVHVLAHDASTKKFLGYTRIGRVDIGNRVFVGTGVIILPGITIGDDVVIGAGSVVTKSIPEGVVAAGNPAKVIGTTAAFLEKRRAEMQGRPVYAAQGHTTAGGITAAVMQEMRDALAQGVAYIE